MVTNKGLAGQVIVKAGTDAIAAANSLSDPIDRARALEVAARNVPDVQLKLRRARAEAIQEAVAARTATSVAAELGITRQRLYKILEDLAD